MDDVTTCIRQGSAAELGFLADDSVALTVTSPPYWNAIDYDRHSADAAQWYRTRTYADGYGPYDEYLDWLLAICAGLKAKTRPGGFLALVLGTLLHDGQHFPVPHDVTTRLVRTGWQFHQDIVWHKCTAGVRRAGSFIQRPYPGYFYPNIMTEYVLVFRRPGPPIYRERDPAAQAQARVAPDELFTRELANNVWHIAPVPPGLLGHPCPFPEEIPYRLVTFYSYPGDLVFDPFVGSGQTTKVARALGRRYAGLDTSARYVELARRRTEQPLSIRPQQLVARFDHVPFGGAPAQGDLPLGNGRRKRAPR